jgi:beta-carotene hydroxylase
MWETLGRPQAANPRRVGNAANTQCRRRRGGRSRRFWRTFEHCDGPSSGLLCDRVDLHPEASRVLSSLRWDRVLRSMKTPFLVRYRIDVWPVGIVLATTGLALAPFLWTMPRVLVAAAWLAVVYLRTFCAFSQHNHAHLPVFHARALNRIYDAILTQNTGYPTALWELQHNRGHHRHYLTPGQDVAAVFYPGTRRVMPRWRYALRGNLTIHRDAVRIGLAERRAGRKSLLAKLAGEVIVQIAIVSALLAFRPGLAFAFFVAPNAFLSMMVWWESHGHHLEMPGTSVYDASVTVEDPAYNFVTFNIGHHAAHHRKPTLHWSLLPALTAKMRPLLDESSIRGKQTTMGARWGRALWWTPKGRRSCSAPARLAGS